LEPQLVLKKNFGPRVLLFTCLAEHAFLSALQQPAAGPTRAGGPGHVSRATLTGRSSRPGASASRNAKQKGRTVAARTIPFPNPPGTAATSRVTSTPPPPPPTGAAKLIQTPRRYRGLHIVHSDQLRKSSQHLSRLAQTQAIVAQVEREVAQRAHRDRTGADLTLLSPVTPSPTSLAARAAHRVVFSLFPAGL
jgi:hypothetical protein